MEHINDMVIFAKVAEHSSFSKAAESLGLAKSTVSKAVAALEQAHTVQLLKRSPRKVSLTEEGRRLYKHCQAFAVEYQKAIGELEQSAAQAHGLLRVSVPLLIGQLMLPGKLPQLLDANPELSVDVDISHTNIDRLEDNTDLAIIFSDLPDSAMIASRLAEMDIVLCASPAYLDKYGTPQTPDELAQHSNLLMTLPNLRRPDFWVLKSRNGREHPVRVKSRLAMNDTLALKQAMLTGGGIVAMPMYAINNELANGQAVQILANYSLPKIPVYAVYHSRANMPAKVRIMIAFIREQLQAHLTTD